MLIKAGRARQADTDFQRLRAGSDNTRVIWLESINTNFTVGKAKNAP